MTAMPTGDTLTQVLENRLGALLQEQRRGTSAPSDRTEIPRIMCALTGRPNRSKLVLMAGLPGSGKTTLARELERRGFLRLCPDERVWQRHGHYGRDFPRGEYRVRERPILAEIATELRAALVAGRDAVMDHGFWTVAERMEWRRLGEQAGADVVLVHLPGDHDSLWSRIKERNAATYDDPNAMFFSEDDLRRHARRFEAPGPEEPHVPYDGRLHTVLKALALADPPDAA